MAKGRRPQFVLDQSFPDSSLLQTRLPDIDLVPLRTLYPDLTHDHDDWQVLQQLRARGGADAFVTVDAKMLSLEKEMVVLEQSRLTLVVFKDVDNDPLTAGALLVAASGRLARALDRRHSQVFQIHLPRIYPEKPQSRLEDIAKRRGGTAAAMRREHRQSPVEMMRDCRAAVAG